MPFKKKRKASAIEPAAAAAADTSPPAKRGRPAKAKPEPVIASPAPAAQPTKRGRPSKAQQEQNVAPLPSEIAQAQATQAQPKKVKPNTSATRTSKRLSNGANKAAEVGLGPRATRGSVNGGTNGAVNENTNGTVVAVKQAKTKAKGKAKALTKKPTNTATETIPVSSLSKSPKATKAKKVSKGKRNANHQNKDDEQDSRSSDLSVVIPSLDNEASDDKNADDEAEDGAPNYWLMKAEPESRIEKGKDVKFSIDDLRAAAEPEGWDGVRNATARNNMRMMLKGDLAFFYHSNCKTPGIAGVMEVVQEHTPDESALDPDHPYYDAKSTADNLKWCKVHVAFRQKFSKLVKLKELQKYAKDGGVLQNMQTLRQTRLSVSKVGKKEWDFIMSLVEDIEEDPTPPAPEARMIADGATANGDSARPSHVETSHTVENESADALNVYKANEVNTELNNQPKGFAEHLRELADPLERFHDNVIESALATVLPASFAPH